MTTKLHSISAAGNTALGGMDGTKLRQPKYLIKAEKEKLIFFRLDNSNRNTVVTNFNLLKKGSNAFTWDVKQLAAGSYFITSTNKNFKVVQVVKQ